MICGSKEFFSEELVTSFLMIEFLGHTLSAHEFTYSEANSCGRFERRRPELGVHTIERPLNVQLYLNI